MRIFQHYTRVKYQHAFGMGSSRLMAKPWFSGALLMLCVVVAMLLANLPFTKEAYHHFLHTKLSISVQSGEHTWFFPKDMSVEKFINDILMVVFFFCVGLEIKREIVCGELSSVKKAMLPVIAAVGGMLAPALIYTCFNETGTLSPSIDMIPRANAMSVAVGIPQPLLAAVPALKHV